MVITVMRNPNEFLKVTHLGKEDIMIQGIIQKLEMIKLFDWNVLFCEECKG